MNSIDILIISIYLLVIFLVGFFVGRKETIDDFFVNRRKTRTLLLIFTVVSTNAGAGTLVGIASASYTSGISFGLTAFIATVVGFIIASIFAPKIKEFGDRNQAYSIGDFFAYRYSARSRYLVGIIIIFSYIFFTAAQYVGVSVLLQIWTGLEFKFALIIAALSMILYTAFAGIKSDFYTDIIHFIVMFFTLVLVAAPTLLFNKEIIISIANLPTEYFSPFNFGGVGFFIGSLIFGAPFMIVSMEIWQRIYAATDKKTARNTMLFSALLNLPFILCGVLFGLVAKSYLVNNIDVPEQALFKVINATLPTGVLGLGMAGILAAFLSTANSMIMVTSTTVFKDFYVPLKSKLNFLYSDLMVGRVITLIVGIVSLIFALYLPNVVQQILNGYYVILVLFPAVIGGFFWKKANAKAAFISVLLGFLLTLVLLPVIPKMAFVPGVFISSIVFVFLSLFYWGKNNRRTFFSTSHL